MKLYHCVTGILFGIIAVVHLLRIIYHWPLIIGSWSAPMAASFIGLVITAGLSMWSFRLMR